jgi:ParB/RepB/Spo0J family partition protein
MTVAKPVSEDSASFQKLTSKEGKEILRRIQKAMSESEYVQVSPKLIRPMQGQPRENFDTVRLESLAESMREAGQIMPGTLRPISIDSNGATYELLDGERRWRASMRAGLPFYRAMSVKIDDKAAPYVVSVISNFNREAHTTLEVLDSIIKMHEMLGLTQAEIAKILGFSPGTVNNFYGMRNLDPRVRDMLDPNLMVRRKMLPVSAAIRIAHLPLRSQYPLALKVIEGQVKLVNLRNEVTKIARSEGIEIREMTVEPRVLRKRLLRRVEIFTSNADNLEKLIAMRGVPHALNGFTLQALNEIEKDLGRVGKSLVRLHERLTEVRAKKSILIPKDKK